MLALRPEDVLAQTIASVRQEQLYCCLTCEAIAQHQYDKNWLKRTGELYALAVKHHGPLNPSRDYTFVQQGRFDMHIFKNKYYFKKIF